MIEVTVAGAVILALIAGTLHWKKRVPRFVAFMLWLAGLGLSAVIMKYVGGFTNISILGVGILTAVMIVSAIVFWEEAVKRNGLHRVRTPLIAVIFGVTLATAGGALGGLVHSVGNTGGSNVNKAVTTLFNNKG